MKFGLLVSEGPYTHQASDSAYQFVVAALARATRYACFSTTRRQQRDPPHRAAGRPPCGNRWSALSVEHKVDLVVCVAAALRRGIKEEVLAPGFRISGLGQLVDSGIKADRLITFGD